jgi:hypothetical protein
LLAAAVAVAGLRADVFSAAAVRLRGLRAVLRAAFAFVSGVGLVAFFGASAAAGSGVAAAGVGFSGFVAMLAG